MRGLDKSEEFRKLALGPLLAEISGKMNQRAMKISQNLPNILIHSTHDTAIAGLLGTLEVFDGRCVLAGRVALSLRPQGLLIGGLISRRP